MPEPVAIAAGVGSLLASSYALSKALYESIDGTIQAPKHLKLISGDIKVFYSLLSALHGYLQDESTASGLLHPAAFGDLEEALPRCIAIFQDLGELVADFLQNDGNGTMSKWQMLRYSWKEKEIAELREHLMAHKMTLNLAVCTANLINTRSLLAQNSSSLETEIKELRTKLLDLFDFLKRAEDRYHEQNVILSNLQISFDNFADTIPSGQPSSSIRTPKTTTAVVSTIDSSTYYSITSCMLEHEACRSDRESACEDFMSLISVVTVDATRDDTASQVTKGNSDVQELVKLRKAKSQMTRCNVSRRQVFVRGLTSNTSLVIDLGGFEIAEDLYNYLAKNTPGAKETLSLFMNGSSLKKGVLIETIPENATIFAKRIPHHEFQLWRMTDHENAVTRLLLDQNRTFLAYSCTMAVAICYDSMEFWYIGEFFRRNEGINNLFALLDHYYERRCQLCPEECRMAVEEVIKGMGYEKDHKERKGSARSIRSYGKENGFWFAPDQRDLMEETSSREMRSLRRISPKKHRSVRQIFTYQGLDLYEN